MAHRHPHTESRSGFSLVEIILSSSLFSLIVTMLAGALIYGRESSVLAGERMRADLRAEEVLEAVRNIRDAKFKDVQAGTFGLATSSAQWTLAGVSDVKDGFTRQVQIGIPDALTRIATVTVSWSLNEQRAGAVTASARIRNWRTAGWRVPAQESVFDNAGTADGLKIQVQGNFAYAVTNATTSNFLIFDVSSTSIRRIGVLGLPGSTSTPTNLAISGTFAYVSSTNDSQELQVVNISSTTAPSFAGSFNAVGNANAQAVYASGSNAYLVRDSSTSDEFISVNISVPASPTLRGSLNLNAGGKELAVLGNFAYVSSDHDTQELQSVNVSNPAAPTLAGSLDLSGTIDALAITGFGSTVFLGQGTQLRAVNVTTPSAPALLGSVAASTTIADMALGMDNKSIFLAQMSGASELRVVDISSSTALVSMGILNAASTTNGIFYDPSRDRAYLIGAADAGELIVARPEE